ncbi:hypothetical protein TNCV_528721 [Trichonephila clavipes]|nr:hypothetical protein TNCV_528721 [Trichonephila clavipes]
MTLYTLKKSKPTVYWLQDPVEPRDSLGMFWENKCVLRGTFGGDSIAHGKISVCQRSKMSAVNVFWSSLLHPSVREPRG